MAFLLISQLVAFSLFPLYFTTLSGPLRRVHFYVYISLVLLIGGFMGNVYSLPITDSIVISGGNLCYGAFMMTSVMFVWIEKDAFILRHLVRLVVLVDIFNITFSFLTHSILETSGIINSQGVPPGLFEISTPLIALGGFLIVAELLLLLFIFEFTKKRKPPLAVTASIYILSFVLVLVLDGIAFPFIAFGISAEIAAIVLGGLGGKVLMAVAYSVPLTLFVVWQRKAFAEFLAVDTVRWRLLASSSAQLIKEMAGKDQDVRRGDIVFRNSTEGLAIVDHAGNVLKANNAFQAMLEVEVSSARIDLANAFWIDGKPVILPQSPKEQLRAAGSALAQHLRQTLLRLRTQQFAVDPAAQNDESGATQKDQQKADRERSVKGARQHRPPRTQGGEPDIVYAARGQTFDSLQFPLAEADFLRFLCQRSGRNDYCDRRSGKALLSMVAHAPPQCDSCGSYMLLLYQAAPMLIHKRKAQIWLIPSLANRRPISPCPPTMAR